jgi:hypothetical protein
MKAALALLLAGALGTACSSGGTKASGGASGTAGTAGTGAAGSGTAGTAGTGTAGSGTAGAASTGTAGSGTAGATGAGTGGGAPDAGADVPPEAKADAREAAALDADAGPAAAGTIVPLYTYPSDSSWTAIVAAKAAHPRVRVVAIVNPDSGPGASRDDAFTTGIAKLRAVGIEVIGYVATGYTSHTVASMEAEIDTWKSFYPGIGGIFFDEQANKVLAVQYYKTLSEYAKAQGLAYTVGNPGTDTDESFVSLGALDTELIYESKGLPALASLGGWHAKYAPSNFGVIPYGAAFDAAFVASARKLVGFIYIQNDDLPNPWDTLPPFFGDLLAALE